MTAEHTPGPWTITKVGSFRFVVSGRDELAADTRPVATVDSMACATDSTAYRWCVANARLIAAAPAMLAALEQIARACEPGIDQSDDEAEQFLANVRELASHAVKMATR